ncbi:MAG: hypothetical protein WD512_19470, partial [Candidatus Paceibacterota bacterium]
LYPNSFKHKKVRNCRAVKQKGGFLKGQCINFLDLGLEAIKQKMPIQNFCEVISIRVENKLITQPICCSPLSLVLDAKKPISETSRINHRVVLIFTDDNSQFIYKNDEQPYANELSFVANMLQCHLNLFSPRIALVRFSIGEEKVVAQAIEFFEGITNLNPKEIADLADAPEQLALCASFCFFLADFDNFNFIGRIVDNNYFITRDPDFEPFRIDELFFENNTPLNVGNLAIINKKLILIDIRPNTDTEFRKTSQQVALDDTALISSLFASFFEPNEENRPIFQERFHKAFQNYCIDFFAMEPILEQLIQWALEE